MWDPVKNELGPKFPLTSVPVSKYFMACKHGKKCAWGLYKSDLGYPEQQAGGVQVIPFPKLCCSKRICFRWNKV